MYFKVLREDSMSYFPSHLENVGRDVVQNGHDVLHQVELRLVPKHILHAQGRRKAHTIMSHTCTQGRGKTHTIMSHTCTGKKKGTYNHVPHMYREEERLIQSCPTHAQGRGKAHTIMSHTCTGKRKGSYNHVPHIHREEERLIQTNPMCSEGGREGHSYTETGGCFGNWVNTCTVGLDVQNSTSMLVSRSAEVAMAWYKVILLRML